MATRLYGLGMSPSRWLAGVYWLFQYNVRSGNQFSAGPRQISLESVRISFDGLSTILKCLPLTDHV